MCSFELVAQKHMNSSSYMNTELNKNYFNMKEKENKHKNKCDLFGVEMNHFRIVKFIQDTKNFLVNSGNKL